MKLVLTRAEMHEMVNQGLLKLHPTIVTEAEVTAINEEKSKNTFEITLTVKESTMIQN